MKHIKKITLSLALITLMLTMPFTTTQAIKTIEEGDRIAYVVKKISASYSYSVNGSSQSGSTSNYEVAGAKLGADEGFNLTVTTKSASLIEFEATQGDTSLGNSSSSSFGFAFGLLFSILYPFIAMGLMSGSFDPDLSEGFSMGDWVYFAPTDVNWDDMQETFSNQTYWEEMSEELPEELNFGGNSEYLQDGDIVSFSFTADGNYINETEEVDLTINHLMRFDYNVLGRNLEGLKIETDIKGTIEDTNTEFKVGLLVVRKSYTGMDAGLLDEIPGFELIIAILSLGLIAPNIRRKRKQ